METAASFEVRNAPSSYPTCSDASCRSSGWKTRRWNRPVATVVISANGEGDRTVESAEVKVSVREASNSVGRNNGEPVSPDIA